MIDLNKIEYKIFPGGELHITDAWTENTRIMQDNSVLCRIQCSDDLMKLALFTDAYKTLTGKAPYRLILPYIPYARQDRVANMGEALSIKVFANILNSLKYQQVIVFDPHSYVCTALIENIRVVPQWAIFQDLVPTDVDLISPDGGALKKIYKIQEFGKLHGRYIPVRTATKHRNTQTNEISDTTLDGQPTHKTCVVVDDICDTGNTFNSLAKVLNEQYEKKILMVTHGIFSKGLDELSQNYDRLLATNSWDGELKSEGKLRVISVEKFLVSLDGGFLYTL